MIYATDKWFRYLSEGSLPEEEPKAPQPRVTSNRTLSDFDQETEESTNRMNAFLSQVDLINEISSWEADAAVDWFDDDYGKLSLNDLFHGKLRRAIPLVSEDAKKLHEIVKRLKAEGWGLPVNEVQKLVFPLKLVTQKRRRRVGQLPDGFGRPDAETNPDPREVEEYTIDVVVADLRLEKTRTITIPKGPRAGETVEKKSDTTMSRAILKSTSMPLELQDWWREKQTYYTKEKQWRGIEHFFKKDLDKDDISMMAILSRHPLDVLRMSDIDAITSCHSEQGGYFQCAVAESRGHGPIAYLVSPQQYEKLMSGNFPEEPTKKSVNQNAADDRRFRTTIVARLVVHEELAEYGKKDFDNKWSQTALDGGEIDYEEYAKEYFIPKWSHSLKNISGFGPEWLTVKNVAAAAEAVHRYGDAGGADSPEDMMEKYGYRVPSEVPVPSSEYADYELRKKKWDQKEEATTWLKQYYEKFPKVAARISSSNRAKDHDDVDQVINGIQDSNPGGFTSLPTSVRKHLNDEWFIRAATAAVNKDNFSLNGLNLQPPEPPEEKKKIADISELDGIEIFRDSDRDIKGIGARARVRLRKFVDQGPKNTVEFAVPEHRQYGLSVPGFREAVTKWAYEEQKALFEGPDGEVIPPPFEDLFRTGGSHGDTRDGTILNKFFAQGGLSDEYPEVDVEHEDEEAEHEHAGGNAAHQYDETVNEVNTTLEAWNNAYESCSLWAEVAEFEDWGDAGEPEVYVSGQCTVRVKLNNAVSVEEETQAGSYQSQVPYYVVGFKDSDGTATIVFPSANSGNSPGYREMIEEVLQRDESYDQITWEIQSTDNGIFLVVSYDIHDESGDMGADAVEDFGQYLYDEWDEKIDQIHEQIRKRLIEFEYLEPSHFDKKVEDEDHEKWAKELEYFRYVGPDDDGEMWFTLYHHSGTERYQTTDVIVPFGLIATRGQTKMVATDVAAIIGGTVTQDGSTPKYVKHTGQAKIAIANEFRRLEAEANAYVARQMNFDFGDPKYDKPEDAFGIDMAKTVFFSTYLVENNNLLSPSQLAQLKSDKSRYLGFGMKIIVKSVDTEKEVEGAFKFVEYIDKNMDRVKLAFETIYREAIEEYEEKQEEVLLARSSRYTMSRYINALDTYIRNMGPPQWDSNHHPHFNQRQASAIAFVEWTEEAFDHMRSYEKRAWIENYLTPLQGGNTMVFEFQPDREAGTPRNFENAVQAQLAEMGASHNQINSYKWEGPKTYPEIYDKVVNPSQKPEIEAPSPDEIAQARSAMAQGDRTDPDTQLEEQIMRIQKLTEKKRDPSHDLRIYRVQLSCGVIDGVGGTDAEIMAEMRGIEGVTTVRPIADSKRRISPTETFTIFEVKFELLGAQSRVDYRDQILVPAVQRISGIRAISWSSVHRTNTQGTVRTVREALDTLQEYGFGSGSGMEIGAAASNLASVRHSKSAPRPTPTPTLDSVAADWAEGGVQAYDFPTSTNSMQYHTLIPVDELWAYRSKNSPHPKDMFILKHKQFDSVYQRLKDTLEDPAAYQEFIAQGAQSPVFVALGQDGKVKITGNEDLVWFAKKSGLQEVPVFFSYQKQI